MALSGGSRAIWAAAGTIACPAKRGTTAASARQPEDNSKKRAVTRRLVAGEGKLCLPDQIVGQKRLYLPLLTHDHGKPATAGGAKRCKQGELDRP